MKTLKLIEQYMNMFVEQDVDEMGEIGEVDKVQETDVNVDVEVKEEPPSPALQSMAELIAAAFVYPPTDKDKDAIEEIELLLVGTHNEPPATPDINPRSVIKNVISRLPKPLRTVYTRGPGVNREGKKDFDAADEILFSQILADAFRYRPKPEGSATANAVSKEYSETNPMKVIETVQRLLQFSDEGIADELQDIKIDTE